MNTITREDKMMTELQFQNICTEVRDRLQKFHPDYSHTITVISDKFKGVLYNQHGIFLEVEFCKDSSRDDLIYIDDKINEARYQMVEGWR